MKDLISLQSTQRSCELSSSINASTESTENNVKSYWQLLTGTPGEVFSKKWS